MALLANGARTRQRPLLSRLPAGYTLRTAPPPATLSVLAALAVLAMPCPGPASAAPYTAAAAASASAATAPASPDRMPGPSTPQRIALDGLTLRNAVGIAIARHPDISRANAVVTQNLSEISVAKAAWYPKIEYGVQPGYGGSFGSGGNDLGSRASVGASQLLYDFGRTRSKISAADANLGKSQHQLADTVETVAANTADTFVELAASQAVIAAAQRQVESMNETRARIGERVRAGLSVSSDRDLAEVATLRASAEVLKARNRFDVAATRLAELIGARPQQVADLAKTGGVIERITRDGGGGRDDQIDDTPSVLAARAAVDAAAANVDLAKAERYPSVSVGVSRSLSTGRANANDDTWVGLSIRGDFSLGRLAQHRIAAAQAQERAAADALENQRLRTRTALYAAQTEAEGAAARLASYRNVIELSRSSRNLYWQEYMLNKRSLTEVITRDREIFLAEEEWINAMADGIRARIKAYAAVGKFVELLRQQEGARDE
ncbi:TolC family protein [Cupriavidus gilardii]|nr:TolC family protein [Cupriavidus gilardii]UXC37063.1 TolC family protein [Cupriavidus gilardii]